ncbi:MAG: hypothetical protein PHE55_04820 [Methylococcaceae bacterium]|nr:hypothetical protein [Methylococcaceae bacterium]
MKKLTVPLLLVSTSAFAVISPNCQTFTTNANPSGAIGQLIPGDCTSIWDTLKASSRFPDTFQYNKTLPGFCFVSANPIPAILNGNPVNLTALSAWTNDFLPAFPPGPSSLGHDNLATAVTQVTVYDAQNTLLGIQTLGKLYTRDSIDLSPVIFGVGYGVSEQDTIVGGSGAFLGARGGYRIDAFLDVSGSVNITRINGSICPAL